VKTLLDHPVATFGATVITYRELLAALARLGAGGGHGGNGTAVKLQLLNALVDERLLQDLAMERGLDRFPEVASRRGDYERVALAQAAAQRILDAAPAPSEADIEAFYRANAAAYARPFAEVLPDVAARAADQKRLATLQDRLQALRRGAAISIDRAALAAIAAGEAR
jgi:hypothetical protein